LLLAQIAGLVGLTEDGAPVLDAPRMSVETEMVVVEIELFGGNEGMRE